MPFRNNIHWFTEDIFKLVSPYPQYIAVGHSKMSEKGTMTIAKIIIHINYDTHKSHTVHSTLMTPPPPELFDVHPILH